MQALKLRLIERCGILVITTVQFHSTKLELRFGAGSNLLTEIRDGENLWQGFRLEIRLSAFRRSTIQKQFIMNCTIMEF